jgi:hypothetical protein
MRAKPFQPGMLHSSTMNLTVSIRFVTTTGRSPIRILRHP